MVPGIGGRLEDDEHARGEVRREIARRGLDEREVGHAVAQRRRDGDDRDVEAREARRIGGRVVSGLERAPQLLAADVLDVGTARCERLDPARSES